MPALNYKNAGTLIDYEYLKGTITAIYLHDDTADVTGLCGKLLKVPIFYHCDEKSQLGDNGSLHGSASGFSVGDEVVVLTGYKEADSLGKVYYIVGHYDGVRKCNPPILYFYLYTGTYSSGQASFVSQLYKEDWFGYNVSKVNCPYVSRGFAWDLTTDDYAKEFIFTDPAGILRTAEESDWPILLDKVSGANFSNRLGNFTGALSSVLVNESMNMFCCSSQVTGYFLKVNDYVWPEEYPQNASRVLFISGPIVITEKLCVTSNMIGKKITLSSWCPIYVKEEYSMLDSWYSGSLSYDRDNASYTGTSSTSTCLVSVRDIEYSHTFSNSEETADGPVSVQVANLVEQSTEYKDILHEKGKSGSVRVCAGSFGADRPEGDPSPVVPPRAVWCATAIYNHATYPIIDRWQLDGYVLYDILRTNEVVKEGSHNCNSIGIFGSNFTFITQYSKNFNMDYDFDGVAQGGFDKDSWACTNPLGTAVFESTKGYSAVDGWQYDPPRPFLSHSVNHTLGLVPLVWNDVLGAYIPNAGCTGEYAWQYYVYPGYENNTFAQCIRREDYDSSPSSVRSAKLEAAIKNLFDVCRPNLIYRFGEGSPVSGHMEHAAIVGQYYSEKRIAATSLDLLELIRQVRNYAVRSTYNENYTYSDKYELIDYQLYEDEDLMTSAQEKAEVMAESFTLSHAAGPIAEGVSELIAMTQSATVDTHKVVAGWMSSPAHYATITDIDLNIAGYYIKTVSITSDMLPLVLTYGTGLYNSSLNTYTDSTTTITIIHPTTLSFVVLQMKNDGRYTS